MDFPDVFQVFLICPFADFLAAAEIKRLVSDLNLPVGMILFPFPMETDGRDQEETKPFSGVLKRSQHLVMMENLNQFCVPLRWQVRVVIQQLARIADAALGNDGKLCCVHYAISSPICLLSSMKSNGIFSSSSIGIPSRLSASLCFSSSSE